MTFTSFFTVVGPGESSPSACGNLRQLLLFHPGVDRPHERLRGHPGVGERRFTRGKQGAGKKVY